MYIQKKSITVILKLVLGSLSLWLLWCIVAQFGLNSFRLFPAWVLFISAAYFLTNATVLLLSAKKFNGKIICPMLEGLLITNFLFMSGTALLSSQFHFYLPMLPSWIVFIVCVIIPLLLLADWALFIKKGAWRTISPVYWLALPVCYAAAMIFATQILPDDAELRYPLEIFNYLEFGILPMLGWMFAAAILILAIGYLFYLIDFTLSGQLAQKVVLPHIQVVEVDENGNVMREIPSHQAQASRPKNPAINHVDEAKPNKAPSLQTAQTKSSKPQSKTKSNRSQAKKSSTPGTPEIIKVEIKETDSRTRHKAHIAPKDHDHKPTVPADSSSHKNKNQKRDK